MRMYVVEGAPRRFNLTPEVVLSIQKNTSIPGPAMFVDAQREVRLAEQPHMPRLRWILVIHMANNPLFLPLLHEASCIIKSRCGNSRTQLSV
jgi:hypothetical protein